jgi:hypothetical protein
MQAETIGMERVMEGDFPFAYFTRGVFSDTFDGTQSLPVYPGINKYSPNVWEGSSKKKAIHNSSKWKVHGFVFLHLCE